LDLELGMNNLSIPLGLFRGDKKKSGGTATEPLGGVPGGNNTAHTQLRFKPPPPFVDVDESTIPSLPLLLQPFFVKRKELEMNWIDDDLNPATSNTGRIKLPRPKVPPAGKIPVKRRVPPGEEKRRRKPVGAGRKAEMEREEKEKLLSLREEEMEDLSEPDFG